MATVIHMYVVSSGRDKCALQEVLLQVSHGCGVESTELGGAERLKNSPRILLDGDKAPTSTACRINILTFSDETFAAILDVTSEEPCKTRYSSS